MKIFNNSHKLITRRRQLRSNGTPQEIMLWSRLKNSQLGYKFRRQHSIDNYILDFYCPEKHLAVEIDGSQHYDKTNQLYDEKRTVVLKRHFITTLRFSNAEINTNMNGVCMKISETLKP